MMKWLLVCWSLCLLVCLYNKGQVGAIISSDFTANYTINTTGSFCTNGAMTKNGDVLMATVDGTSSQLLALDVSSNYVIKQIDVLVLGICNNLITPFGDFFFVVCNCYYSGGGPTNFFLVSFINRNLAIRNSLTVPQYPYGYFNSILATDLTNGIIYLSSSYVSSDAGQYIDTLYIFNVTTFNITIIGVIPTIFETFVNGFITPDLSNFITSVATSQGGGNLTRFSLPSMEATDHALYKPSAQFVFSIPVNDSYATFWVGLESKRMEGLVYQNFDFDTWTDGAALGDQNSTFYSSGIYYAMGVGTSCLYIGALAIFPNESTLSQILLSSNFNTPQEIIAQALIPEYLGSIPIGANDKAVFAVTGSSLYTYPATCSL